ncbi:MAG: hypothetical protein RQ741_03055 [Wenzhouxiangellaceae bacterium]|nr:hypothetical protein [Wenzhouxiangellaceae bacterium]
MKFESEDIPVHLGSEGFATLLGVQSSYSAIRVQVPDSYAARAIEIYQDLMRALDQPVD